MLSLLRVRLCLAAMLCLAMLSTPAFAEPATLYGDGTDGYAGRLTATGDVCCPGYTMAHPDPSLLGHYATVCRLGVCVDVLINDVGSIPDLSPAAAEGLGMFGCGICDVEITIY